MNDNEIEELRNLLNKLYKINGNKINKRLINLFQELDKCILKEMKTKI
jgi:hypothetical protein